VRIKASLDGLAPGRLVCLDAQLGGYEADRGWVGDSAGQVVPTIEATPVESDEGWSSGDDPGTYVKSWVTLDEHTDHVVAAMEEILVGLEGLQLARLDDLRLATRWHDRGKAHEVFQDTLLQGLDAEERASRIGTMWAKSGSSFRGRHKRSGFRHELASGIALLDAKGNALAAYLAASHHGKVRMALRSLPGEYEAAAELGQHPERLARGLYEGDVLPAVDMGGGVLDPERRLSLGRMEMGLGADGQPSWQEGTMKLLDELGPFRLGLLEALLRAADARGSRVGACTKVACNV
jgi:CRISPR-associated endonuclease/helicase Cas3